MAISDALRQRIATATNNARAGGGGDDLRDGSYLMTIEKIVVGEMNSGLNIVLVTRVDEATQTREDVKPNAVGSSTRFVMNFTDPRTKDVAPKNWREILEAIDGTPQNSMTHDEIAKYVEMCADDETAFRGIRLRCTSFRRMKKDKSKELVLPAGQHIPGQTEESIAAQRAALDKTA